MFEELFKEYIGLVKKQTGKDTKYGVSKHIEESLTDGIGGFKLSYKTIQKYYQKIIEGDTSLSYAPPHPELKDVIAIALGYENYADYLKQNHKDDNPKIVNQHASGKYGININTDNFSGNIFTQDATKKD